MQLNFDYGSLGINESNKEEYIEMLGYDFKYFVPTEYLNSDKVSIEIEFDISKLISYQQLMDRTDVYKLQAIKSLIELVINTNRLLAINLDEENLYFSSNTSATQLTKVLDATRLNEEEYVNQIKGLLGNLFMKESSNAIISSNGQLLEKNELLRELAKTNNLETLNDQIDNLISEQITYNQEQLTTVNKDYVKKNKRTNLIKSIIIAILVIVSGFLIVIYIPNRTSQLDAIVAYEDKVYEDVLTSLEKTNITTMSPVMKYIESESTIRLSQLSDNQKDNILYNLSPSVEEGILDFWVYIGQNNLEMAYDQSIKNNDAQQKAYVLLLLIDSVQNDTDLKTEEKESLVSQYQTELDSIAESMTEEKE